MSEKNIDCEVSTFDMKTHQTTFAASKVATPGECVDQGITAAAFSPNAMAITSARQAPYKDVGSFSFHDSLASDLGNKNLGKTVQSDLGSISLDGNNPVHSMFSAYKADKAATGATENVPVKTMVVDQRNDSLVSFAPNKP